MSYYKTGLFFVCMYVCIISFAQDVSQLKKLTIHYNQAVFLNMHAQMHVFNTNNEVIYSEETTAHKQDDYYYSKSQKIEMLTNKINIIVVNHELKQIMVSPYNKAGLAEQQLLYSNQIDSLLIKADKVGVSELKNHLTTYSIHCAKQAINLTEITVNVLKKTIDKIVYHYRKDLFEDVAKVEINFTHTDFHKNSNHELFDDKRFVLINKNKELIPARELATYEVVITSKKD
jgi:hypothetical protein